MGRISQSLASAQTRLPWKQLLIRCRVCQQIKVFAGCRAILSSASGRPFDRFADCWQVHAAYEITGVDSAVSSFAVSRLFAETILTGDITLPRADTGIIMSYAAQL